MHHFIQQQTTSSTLLLLGQCGTHHYTAFLRKFLDISSDDGLLDIETDDRTCRYQIMGFESGVYQWAISSFIKRGGEHWRIQMMNQMGKRNRQKKGRRTDSQEGQTKTKGKSRAKAAYPTVERSQKVKRNQNLFRKLSKRKIAVGSRRW